jgi:hypothetical protein
MKKSEIIRRVCDALEKGNTIEAAEIAKREYPFVPIKSAGRQYTEHQSTRIFVRDGFVDRYSGVRLVFPGALRLLSRVLPEEFPTHPNWKMSESHIVFWELFPTIDHIVPVARGGADDESNWVTASMIRNSAKSNWTLEELGWDLAAKGNINDWDGLMAWFVSFVVREQKFLEDPYLKRWNRAAIAVLGTGVD